MGLLLGGDSGDTVKALVVLLNLVRAVALEALLLEVELNILSVGHSYSNAAKSYCERERVCGEHGARNTHYERNANTATANTMGRREDR